ncbi:MAG: hypothetical protein DRO11_00430 [Methanobacteriota archaeon]|nr:MAG: hypothetical protein DRO11_00430 [Euryarchaeota archaeon]
MRAKIVAIVFCLTLTIVAALVFFTYLYPHLQEPTGLEQPPAKTPRMDGDFDGVPDGVDACPETPLGEQVDPSGCEPIKGGPIDQENVLPFMFRGSELEEPSLPRYLFRGEQTRVEVSIKKTETLLFPLIRRFSLETELESPRWKFTCRPDRCSVKTDLEGLPQQVELSASRVVEEIVVKLSGTAPARAEKPEMVTILKISVEEYRPSCCDGVYSLLDHRAVVAEKPPPWLPLFVVQEELRALKRIVRDIHQQQDRFSLYALKPEEKMVLERLEEDINRLEAQLKAATRRLARGEGTLDEALYLGIKLGKTKNKLDQLCKKISQLDYYESENNEKE